MRASQFGPLFLTILPRIGLLTIGPLTGALSLAACHATEPAAAPAEEPQVPIRTADELAADRDAAPLPDMAGRHDQLKCKDPDVSKCTTVMPDPYPGSARVRRVHLVPAR